MWTYICYFSRPPYLGLDVFTLLIVSKENEQTKKIMGPKIFLQSNFHAVTSAFHY